MVPIKEVQVQGLQQIEIEIEGMWCWKYWDGLKLSVERLTPLMFPLPTLLVVH